MTTVDVRMLAAAAATVLLKLAIGYLVLTHRRGSKSKREHAPRGDASAVPRHGAASEIPAGVLTGGGAGAAALEAASGPEGRAAAAGVHDVVPAIKFAQLRNLDRTADRDDYLDGATGEWDEEGMSDGDIEIAKRERGAAAAAATAASGDGADYGGGSGGAGGGTSGSEFGNSGKDDKLRGRGKGRGRGNGKGKSGNGGSGSVGSGFGSSGGGTAAAAA